MKAKVKKAVIATLVTMLMASIVFGIYYWESITVPVEVKEPLEIAGYPSLLSLYAGTNETFAVNITNHAKTNYLVTMEFALNNTEYQEAYVTFSDNSYIVKPGDSTLEAWIFVSHDAPPANLTLTVDLTRTSPPKYTTGLTVKFKIYDTATYALLDTGDVSPEFYASNVDPIGTRIFSTTPVAVGAYFSTGGYWTVPLDAGSYVVLIKKGTTTILPEKYSVTVSGTDSEDKEVWLNPSTLNVYEKATVTITKTYIAYNATAGTYSISVASINTTKYDKWLVTLTFSVSGIDKIVKAGRIYQTKISGLVPEEYSLDGAVKTTVLEDTEASDDGMTGYYNEFAEWTGGEMHRLDLYFNDYGVTGISGTITVKLFQYYACKNTVLRGHWTDETTTLIVTT